MKLMIYAILLLKEQSPSPAVLLSSSELTKGMKFRVIKLENLGVAVREITGLNPENSKTEAIQYASVIELLSRQFALLPMRLGSIAESDEVIAGLLERNLQYLYKSLFRVENKDEFGLKIFCDCELLRKEFNEQTKAQVSPRDIHQDAATESVYRNYIFEKLKEHRFEEKLLSDTESIIADIQSFLNTNEGIGNFKKRVSENTLLDAVFLINKEKKELLLNHLRNLQPLHPGFSFFITGPWPPYSFVDITLK